MPVLAMKPSGICLICITSVTDVVSPEHARVPYASVAVRNEELDAEKSMRQAFSKALVLLFGWLVM